LTFECVMQTTRELHQACEQGDLNQVLRFTEDTMRQEKRNFIDYKERFLNNDHNGCTILHTAARFNRVNVIQYLFASGMSLEVEDKTLATPLLYAIMNNSGDAVAYLISKGANVNTKDVYNRAPLLIVLSSNNGDTSIAEMLLRAGADINIKLGSNDHTLLDDACQRGDLSQCQFLLNASAFMLRKDADDRTCLYYALQHPNIIRLLCKRAMELNQLSKLIRILDRDKNTIIHLAVIHNHPEALSILLDLTIEYNELFTEDIINEKGKDGQTPFHLAVMYNNINITNMLVQHPLVNLNAQNERGDTPMHVAIRQGNGNILETLLECDLAKTSLQIKNADKFTPQELAKELHVDVDHVFNGFKDHRFSALDFVGRDTIRKYRFVVFVFYRGSWSRACKNMLERLNIIVDDVHALNGELIGVSSESAASRSIMKSLKLAYNVIDDDKGELAKQLGVKVYKRHSAAIEGLIKLYRTHNILNTLNKIEHRYPNGMAQPAIVIVRRDGQVVYRWISTPLEKNAFGMFERIEVPHIATLIKFYFNNVIQIESISRFIVDNREKVLDNIIHNSQLREMFLNFLEKEKYSQSLLFVERMNNISNENARDIFDTFVHQTSVTAIRIPSRLCSKFETIQQELHPNLDFLMELFLSVMEELQGDRLDNFITTPDFVERGIKLLPFTFTVPMDVDELNEKSLSRSFSSPRMINDPKKIKSDTREVTLNGPKFIEEANRIRNVALKK
jgi:ankyrin repeat protein/peroxiredoxin